MLKGWRQWKILKPAVCASMDAAKVEFLAEQELVTITQNFNLDKIYFMGAGGQDLGPFNPFLPVEVPLWLAINLKQRSVGCFLWIDVEKLEKIRDHE